MQIRLFQEKDLNQLKVIWEKYYKDDFVFPIQNNRCYLDKFIVTDDNDNIICFGGPEVNIELSALTNQDFNKVTCGRALLEIYRASLLSTARHNFNHIYVSQSSDSIENWLIKEGFRLSNGKWYYKGL